MKTKAHGTDDALKVFFREATARDMSAVAELLQELGYCVSWHRLKSVLAHLLENPEYHCVLAVSSVHGRIVGMMTLRVLECLRLGGRQVSIEELVVHADWRGQGVGRALTDYAVACARRQGAVRIEVLTSESRQSTQRGFYDKAGFEQAFSRVYRKQLGDEGSTAPSQTWDTSIDQAGTKP